LPFTTSTSPQRLSRIKILIIARENCGGYLYSLQQRGHWSRPTCGAEGGWK
jgi:hypothetical protein